MSETKAVAGDAAGEAVGRARVWSEIDWADVGSFAVVAAQLGLLLVLLSLLEIEPGSGLPRLLPLVFGGFVVHAALPLRYRLPFFLFLSFAAFGLVLGPVPAVVLVLLGLGLIGICHLPVAFSTRVVLLLVAGGALAALRAGWAPAPLEPLAALSPLVLPVLGSMFMFRLFIYLYDLRAEERERAMGRTPPGRAGAPATVWTRLSYFFLLPNVSFLLFPVVDYRTYRRTYFDRPATEIYQKGVWWICVGLTHLLLYRLVYYYLVPSPEEVQGLGGVVRLMTSSYLIYFRVSGLFHLITGMLCLFGFNLSPFHWYFLLASSFTDFWRRARIDWKDFMVKVFYYPALVPLQRAWGTLPAMALATVAVFVVTWLLHSYQWFWLRGDFPLSRTDAAFWTIFGGCVLVNSLLEAKRGKKRAPSAGWGLAPAVRHALQVVGMFVFLCVLWSYWSSPTFGAWWGLVSAAGDSGPGAYVALFAALAAVVAAGVLAQYILARRAPPRVSGRAPARVPSPAPFAWRPVGVGALAALLLLVGVPASRGAFGAPVAQLADRLGTNGLNAVDQEREDRSYYEVLLDTPRSTYALAAVGAGVEGPEEAGENDPGSPTGYGAGAVAGADGAGGEKTVRRSQQFIRDSLRHMEWRRAQMAAGRGPSVGRRVREYEAYTEDLRLWENTPNFSGSMKGAAFRTNRWGMADRDYELAPPAGTYRIALVGSSMTVGAGVPIGATMETLTEQRLNRQGPGAPQLHYELLNFSVGGYGVMQNVALVDQNVFRFAPDAILVSVFSLEVPRMTSYLTKVVRNRIPIPYPYVRQKLQAVGAEPTMEVSELRRRIGPIAEDLVRWSYAHILEEGRRRGIPVMGVVLPEPIPKAGRDIDQAFRLAASSGLPLLDLRDVYQGQDIAPLKLEGRDPHWSSAGHKLVSDRLFQALRGRQARVLHLGVVSRARRGTAPPARRAPADEAPALETAPGSGAEARRTTPPAPQAADNAALDDDAPLGGGERAAAPFIRLTDNALGYELVPSFDGTFKGAPLRTNRWGMRDQDYARKPPPDTYRMALLGGSFTFGAGVPMEQTVEWRLEARLNREGPGAPDRHYEMLNFSVMRYGLLQYLYLTEHEVFDFEPDAVLIAVHSLEKSRLTNRLIFLLRNQIPIEYPYIRQKLQEAGVRPDMEEMELRRRLAPVAPDLVRWGYQRIAAIGRARGVPVVGIVFPEPRKGTEKDLAETAATLSAVGIPLLDLRGMYDGHSLASLRLPRDVHLNARGHEVVADRLYQVLRANDARTLELGFAAGP